MGKQKEDKPKPCPRGAHAFGPTMDPWYEKCYHCPALKRNASIKVKSVPKNEDK